MAKIIILSALSIFILTGCTVKKIVKPSGPSYEQQQKSFDKAYKGM